MINQNTRIKKLHVLMFFLYLIVLAGSVINPYSYTHWVIQALPSIFLALTLLITYTRFKFSTFAYTAVFIYSIIALIGAKYTLGISPSLPFYDRITYFTAGFALTALAKEFTLKKGYFKREDIYYFFMISIAAGVTQFYTSAVFFIASISNIPGYDELTQNQLHAKMVRPLFLALVGSIIAITTFRKIHDKEIE